MSGRGYLVRDAREWFAFVPVGGAFVRTHWCALVVDCPSCAAKAGALCSGRDGGTIATHADRRKTAQRAKQDPKVRRRLERACPGVAFALDLLDEIGGPS